jgi:hypothetical protein
VGALSLTTERKIMISLICYFILFIAFIVGLVKFIRFIIRKIRHRNEPQKNSLNRDFARFMNRAKWKQWGRIAGLVLVILSAVYVVFDQANSSLMYKAYTNAFENANNYFSTQAPNVAANNLFVTEYGTFNSNIHADTYKDLDGVRVPWQPYDQAFGDLPLSPKALGDQALMPMLINNAWYTQGSNQKIATFFSPTASYKGEISHKFNQTIEIPMGVTPTHDAAKIATVPNMLAEVAVSFKEPLTYAQIQQLVPKNLLINWYWLGYDNAKNQYIVSNTDYYGIGSDVTGGFKGNPLSGKLSDFSYNMFVTAVKQSPNITPSNSFDAKADALKQIKKYPTLDKAKFAGVILTGRTENFANLDTESWVFATNVGLTTSIRPDIQLTK